MAVGVSPEAPHAPFPAALGIDDIVARMQLREADQSKELRHYEALRHYKVQYVGLGTSIVAKMDVEITFDQKSGKNFRVVSQSGSKLLCDKVLKRAVDSEEEASHDQVSNALSPANYHFALAGTTVIDGRATYILQVEPWHESKFLFKGKVWVDAEKFAVTKVEAEPAQNPSFWISHTLIQYSNTETDGIWLPAKNRSESKIRIGGTAVLSIDYGDYHVERTESEASASNPLQPHS